MEVGRRIYYDKSTGNILIDTQEIYGFVTKTTVDHDINSYKELSDRNRESFDFIELEYGEYRQDFTECNGYRINTETLELEFSYPDPNEPEPQEPVYVQPLTEQVTELKTQIEQENTDTQLAIAELAELVVGGE
ncbi:hypothetical protein [Cytobacillus sp. IB215316]|uniref:hypothetical protein n=1 Tax=Cytobacillus sp. IB215316 TaxID=3097354 RepID=UPI002A0B0E3C|nr:hypothetical protein [Cytobacillus sp. IB215316]MDX8359832.1 hypothetical protein [Cytobacillus sp. IB215316]